MALQQLPIEKLKKQKNIIDIHLTDLIAINTPGD